MTDLQQLAAVLEQTLQPNPAQRKLAEQQLHASEQQPGFCNSLLMLVCADNAADTIRMAAAIAFKNFIKKNWGATPEVDVPADEEQQIRDSMVQAMFRSSGNLQDQLSHALHLAATRDFPERWPTLVPSLAVHLASDDLEQLTATLSALDQLFKKFRYETKSTELWLELKGCLTAVESPLTQLYSKMVNMAQQKDSFNEEQTRRWLGILHHIVRVFQSLCSQDIPEFFEDNLKTWVEGFLVLLELNCPSQVSAAGEPTNLDKLKEEICSVVTLYAQRYEEEINSFMQSLIQAVWRLIVNTGPETRYDGMVCAALEFLSIICQKLHYESYFTGDGVLKTIAKDVCVSNLRLRQEDLELFEDEPLDYMNRDVEGTDAATRRRGAVDLVRSLCRRFEPQLIEILGECVQDLSTDGSWQASDVIYSLVTAMASKSETAKSGATNVSQLVDVNDFYMNRVRGHLSGDVNADPILKADAFKFVVTFRNQLRPEILAEVVAATDRILGANLPILHKYAAYTIDKLLLVRQPGTTNPVLDASKVPVATLLTSLVSAFDKDPKSQNSPYLIKAVLRVVAILDDETSRHASAIASKLATLVASAIKNPAHAVHTHFLFETMCVLIKKTTNVPRVALDADLMPLVETVLSQDIADLIPYALQITGVLLTASAARGTIAEHYFTFLPFLLAPELWKRSANVPAALSVVGVYLRCCPENVLGSQSNLLMQHYVRLMGSKSLDTHGFELINAMLPHLEKIQGIDNPVKVILNTMFQRISQSKTSKFLKLFIVFLARFAIVRGAQDLYAAATSIQANMFTMIMEKVVIAELGDLERLTTFAEKRVIAIGFANIFADLSNILQNLYGTLATGIVKVVEAPCGTDKETLSPEEEQATMYNPEGEFTNPYCRLSYAPKPEPIAADIKDFKMYLAQAIMVRGTSQNPQLMACLPELLQNHLRTYVGFK